MLDSPTASPSSDESGQRAGAPEALTLEPVGHGVYRYSVAPSSTCTTEDLGRILGAIVNSEQAKPEKDEG